jgi:hypothetical protein
MAELEKVVGVALLPDTGANAETVLHHMHPINEANGFTSEIFVREVEEKDPSSLRLVRNVLNAGSTLKAVQRDREDQGRYYIHKDLYKTLARIRARSMFSGYGQPQLAAPHGHRGARYAGSLTEQRTALPDHTRTPPPLPADQQLLRLKEELRAALLRSMGLDEAAFALVSRPELVGDAVAAGKALEQLKDSDAIVSQDLRRREKEMREALRSTYHGLWSRQGDDESRLEALNAAHGEIEPLIPALMLAPRGPYEKILWQLISELERAAGPDDGLDDESQALLDRLRGHAAAIAMAKRDSAESWRKAGRLVFAWDDGGQSEARITNA